MLTQDVNDRGNCVKEDEGMYGHSLYSLLAFSINLKVLQKNKVNSKINNGKVIILFSGEKLAVIKLVVIKGKKRRQRIAVTIKG